MGHHPPRHEPGRRTPERTRRPSVTHPHYRKDNPTNDPMAKTTAEWPGIEDAAGLLNFRIAEWHDFGYVNRRRRPCKTTPPLGGRSAQGGQGRARRDQGDWRDRP
jgi:hypothetical protein